MTDEPAKPNWFKLHKLLTGIVGVILLFIIIGATSSSPQQTSNTSNQNTTATTATSSTPSLAQQQTTWNSKYKPDMVTIANDLQELSNDANDNASLAIYSTDCQQFEQDITVAQNDPPMPIQNAEQHWSSALSYFSSSAQDCIAGVNNNDVDQIEQAGSELSQGTTQIKEATQAIQYY